MNLAITLEANIRDSFRVQQVLGMFGMPLDEANRVELAVELPPPAQEWTIGAIVGPSGSGKTTLARRAWPASPKPPRCPRDRAIIDCFSAGSLRQTLALLAAVGFNSPPAWLRPFHLLSTGEQFRCNLARWLLRSVRRPCPLVVDEFTSHLDRDTARSCSFALQRFLRRGAGVPSAKAYGRRDACPTKFVAVTCHEDVLPWLLPDWVLRLPEGTLERGPFSLPSFPLHFERTGRAMWNQFRGHHYLSSELARGATCYLARWDGRAAAFCAVLGQVGHAGRKRISRLVTLPQFQGMGIGMALAEHVCTLETERGFRVSLATSHPAVIHACRKSSRWKFLGIKRCGGTPQCIRGRPLAGSSGRIVAAFEFLPVP